MTLEAILSVLMQDYRPIEIIVVDDGSTDDTLETLTRFAQARSEVRIIQRKNGGPGAARETGRLAARGEFIQYLDSDDILLPEKFTRQVAALLRSPQCGVSYCMTRFRKAGGEIIARPWKGSGEHVETMFPAFLVSRWWDTPNPLYRQELCDRAGPWLTTHIEEDWEYDCRIASFGVRLAYVQEYLCEVRDHRSNRLSRGGLEPSRLKDRAFAHARIYEHALKAGIELSSPEMQHFSRALFLLARQCGAAALETEARALFALAQEASVDERKRGWDFRIVSVVADIVGWRWAGKLACELDRLRS